MCGFGVAGSSHCGGFVLVRHNNVHLGYKHTHILKFTIKKKKEVFIFVNFREHNLDNYVGTVFYP